MPVQANEFENKTALREHMKKIRSNLTIERIMVYSTIITKKVISSAEYINSDVILSYASFSSEVNTHFLINHALANQKKVAVPKTLEGHDMEFFYINSLKELSEGRYGILEPGDSAEKAEIVKDKKYLLILPGIAFDEKRNRLGYGGGYYDRFLEKYKGYDIFKLMLAYELEKADSLPVDKYDMPSDRIITEVNTY